MYSPATAYHNSVPATTVLLDEKSEHCWVVGRGAVLVGPQLCTHTVALVDERLASTTGWWAETLPSFIRVKRTARNCYIAVLLDDKHNTAGWWAEFH
jgi:hypothetical protein